MPVLVTQADAGLGPDLVARLLEEGGEVRAYCTGEGSRSPLRQAGAIVADGDIDDEGHLEAAMEQVHTVVDLSGGPLDRSEDAVLVAGRTVLTAAVQAGVRRLIRLSVPGASPTSDDPLRRTEGVLEAELREADLPTVVVRTSLVDTQRLRDAIRSVASDDQRDTTVAPVRPDDLVEALAVLDAVRSEAHSGHVVFHAEGQRMSLGDYLSRIDTGSRVGRPYVARSDVPLLGPSLSEDWVTGDDAIFDVWDFTSHRPLPIGVGGS